MANLPALATSDISLLLRPLSSTGITRPLRYYGPLRHLSRPGPALAGLRFEASAPPQEASRVASELLYIHALATTPAEPQRTLLSRDLLHGTSLPHIGGGSASALDFSRPAWRSLTLGLYAR